MNNLIYLKSVSTLVEVLTGESQKAVYIGSNQLTRNYSNPFEDGFHNANWNRSLKFKNKFIDAKNEKSDNLTYYKLDMDLYLDLTNKQIVCLSKKPKDRFIIDLKEFKDEMIPLLVKNYNKNKIVNDLDLSWILDEYIDFEYVVERNRNINRWIVNDDFEFTNKKYKWKVLLVESNDTKYELTKYGQIIYYFNSLFTNLDNNLSSESTLIDLDNARFYINGYYPLKDKLLLNISIVDLYEKQRLENDIFNQFDELFKNDDLYYYHMFNITSDIKYLIDLITIKYKCFDYQQLMEQLNDDAKQLNMSYLVQIFNIDEMTNYLLNKYKDEEDQQLIRTNIERFKK